MSNAYIVSAVRTPIGRHGGVLKTVRPDDLAALVLREAVARAGITPEAVDEVVLGCANQAGEDNRNVARMALLLAGFPADVPGLTVNRLCASGLAAVATAARAIKAGEAEILLAGGVESMTRAPYVLPKTSPEYAFGNQTAYDTTLGWRFVNPRMTALHGTDAMGETAENIAEREAAAGTPITREEQDAFALESHRRAVAAIESGRFAEEIVTVSAPQPKGDPVPVSRDEHPRADTSLEALARLKPAFRKGGTVTAGNSSGINDGAAALVLVSERKLKELGLTPLARVVGSASAGVEPRVMGYGPVPATRKVLALTGLAVEDLGLIELNEAFAVQALAVMRQVGFKHAITNVNGGAIALGHPLGCSGARILTTLTHELRRRPEVRYGLATLCVGVGQGEAMIIERLA
ncbi:MAG: acetyl-CoA C-acyltransferase [Anaerolineales bacterium]|nr:acetyl-CoA C-acyltransferase [Anaerolineales bacterium]